MNIRWDDMRAERVLVPVYQRTLEVLLNSRIKGTLDVQILREECEKKFAQYIGKKNASLVNSGTDAFDIGIEILGLKRGDSVIVPNLTYGTIPQILIEKGIKPVIIEINRDTLNIDERLIEKNIRTTTRAIVVSHMFGRSCDMRIVKNIAKRNKLFLIEDACQSFASTYRGAKLGSLGDISIFSFSFHKPISSCGGGGGMICFDNKHTKIKVQELLAGHFDSKRVLKKNKRYTKISFFDALSLNVKFKYLDVILRSRREIKSFYEKELKYMKEINVFEDVYNESIPGLNFTVLAENRDRLADHLLKKGIKIIPWDYPCSVLNRMKKISVFAKGKYPASDDYHKKALHLPLFSLMKSSEAADVIQSVREFYGYK